MIPRHLLPQIPGDQIDEFVEYLNDNDVDVKLRKIPVEKLKPIQAHVNREKVEKLMKDQHLLSKPIIVSKGGFVLDGHHRWLAAKELDPKSSILAYVCDTSIRELVNLGHQFDGSFTKTVHEHSSLYADNPNLHSPDDDAEELMVRKTLRPIQ